MNEQKIDVADILREFYQIASARDWHSHHTPANLAAAISVEAAELLREFQWSSPSEKEYTQEFKKRVGDEVADTLMYLLVLCDKLRLDPIAAVESKLDDNRKRFLPR